MATCSRCRHHKIDEDGDHVCANRDLAYTDHVAGRRGCYVLNPDGHCEHFKQSRRVEVTGMLVSGAILVIIVGSFVLWEWSETRKAQRVLKKQAIELKKEQEAKQPVRVWKGTAGEFEVYIEEFEPLRE